MNKEEIFESVLNSLSKDGFARVCPVCENEEEGDNCPVYGSCDEIDLGWWENKNLNCGGFRPIEGWEDAFDARMKKEDENL